MEYRTSRSVFPKIAVRYLPPKLLKPWADSESGDKLMKILDIFDCYSPIASIPFRSDTAFAVHVSPRGYVFETMRFIQRSSPTCLLQRA
jgi:hypothetical protein